MTNANVQTMPSKGSGASAGAMKAVAVHPGRAGSLHLRRIPRPSLEDVPGGRGVLVRVLRVGVDGTDKEINAAEYGKAPPATTTSSPDTNAWAASSSSATTSPSSSWATTSCPRCAAPGRVSTTGSASTT